MSHFIVLYCIRYYLWIWWLQWYSLIHRQRIFTSIFRRANVEASKHIVAYCTISAIRIR